MAAWPKGVPQLGRGARRLLAAVSVFLLALGSEEAQEVGCRQIEGTYRTRENKEVDVKLLNGSIVQFARGDAGHQGFRGVLHGPCFGMAVFPDAEEYMFDIHDGTARWSNGEVWKQEHTDTNPVSENDGPQQSHGAEDEPELDEDGEPIERGPRHGTEEGEEEEFNQVTITVAVMLFFMLAGAVGLLYLVNYRDENIRFAAYNMISVTMSIFSAVLVNSAIFTFVEDQLLGGTPPRGLGIGLGAGHRTLVGVIAFVSMWVALNVAAWGSRHDHRTLYAVTHLGAHLLAFAGIHAGEHALELPGVEPPVVLLVAWLVFLAGRFVAGRGRFLLLGHRKRFRKAGHEPLGLAEQLRLQRFPDLEGCEAVEEILEAEDEAMVLACTFLLNKWICKATYGNLEEERTLVLVTRRTIFAIVKFALFFMVLLIGMQMVIRRVSSGWRSRWKRQISTAVTFVANSMSWCLLLGSELFWTWVAKRIEIIAGSLMLVIDAFSVSVGSVMIIMVLDFWADKAEEKVGEHGGVPAAVHGHGGAVEDADSCAQRMEGDEAAGLDLLRGFDEGVRALAAEKAVQVEDLAQVLRAVIASFGLLVALSWDRAFEAADEAIIEGLAREHHVMAKVLLAVLLSLFVTPAWIWYMVPQAMRDQDHHKVDIRAESQKELDDVEEAESSTSDEALSGGGEEES